MYREKGRSRVHVLFLISLNMSKLKRLEMISHIAGCSLQGANWVGKKKVSGALWSLHYICAVNWGIFTSPI